MNSITISIGILIGVLLLHLVEEVKTGFRERFPLGEMPKSIFVGINIGIYSYSLLLLFLSATGHPQAHVMTWPLAMAMLLNGIGHIGIMIIRRAYFPGGGTAMLLLVAAAMVVRQLLIH